MYRGINLFLLAIAIIFAAIAWNENPPLSSYQKERARVISVERVAFGVKKVEFVTDGGNIVSCVRTRSTGCDPDIVGTAQSKIEKLFVWHNKTEVFGVELNGKLVWSLPKENQSAQAFTAAISAICFLLIAIQMALFHKVINRSRGDSDSL